MILFEMTILFAGANPPCERMPTPTPVILVNVHSVTVILDELGVTNCMIPGGVAALDVKLINLLLVIFRLVKVPALNE